MIGGDSPSGNRWIAVVIWNAGVEVIIPIIWCQSILGLFRPPEAQAVKDKIEAWIGVGGGFQG